MLLAALAVAAASIFSLTSRRNALRLMREELQVLQQESRALSQSRTNALQSLAALEKSRSEIDRLNALTDPNAEATLQSWLQRLHLLKERLEKMPEKKIPELKYLTEEDWLEITREIKLEDDFDFAKAINLLRFRSKCTAPVSGNIQIALAEYLDTHSDQMPANILELKPYLHTPVDDDVLNRYGIVYQGSTKDLPDNKVLIKESQIVDNDYDQLLIIKKDSMYHQDVSKNGDAVKQAIKAYTKAHNSQKPTKAGDLLPFLTAPLTPAQLDHHWSKNKPKS